MSRKQVIAILLGLGYALVFWAVWLVYPHWWIAIPLIIVGVVVGAYLTKREVI